MKLADQSHASDVRCPLIRPGSVLLSRVYGSCLTVSCWTHVSLARSCWIRVLQAAITIRLFLKRRTFVFFCFCCLKKLCAGHFFGAKKKHTSRCAGRTYILQPPRKAQRGWCIAEFHGTPVLFAFTTEWEIMKLRAGCGPLCGGSLGERGSIAFVCGHAQRPPAAARMLYSRSSSTISTISSSRTSGLGELSERPPPLNPPGGAMG